jgi:hypothetical protein
MGLWACSGGGGDAASERQSSGIGDVAVGETITFGSYGGQELGWRVLEVQDGRALVITEDIIDVRVYNEERNENTTWERCTLRQWLNDDFYNSAFSEAERFAVELTHLQNLDNSEYGTPGGNETNDYIFLLSIDEAERYFSSDNDRIATLNISEALIEDVIGRIGESRALALADSIRIIRNVDGLSNWWWLRSPGWDNDSAACVRLDGYINNFGVIASVCSTASGPTVSYDGEVYLGIRPALWLNL